MRLIWRDGPRHYEIEAGPGGGGTTREKEEMVLVCTGGRKDERTAAGLQ